MAVRRLKGWRIREREKKESRGQRFFPLQFSAYVPILLISLDSRLKYDRLYPMLPGGKAIYRGFQKFVKLLKEQYEVFLEVNTHLQ